MTFQQDVYSACRVSSRVFVLNPLFRRANFYSQQLRALALIREIFQRDELGDGRHELIVIGGGVAGLTAAAAGLTGKVGVTLVEKENAYLTQYLEAHHRELHPNLISWPFQRLRAMTNLPFLNWTCSSAPTVVKQILAQWRHHFAPHATPINAEAVSIEEAADYVQVNCSNGAQRRGDVVIVTVGWNRERCCGAFQGLSYWTQQAFEPPGDVVISGTGDGGLIDSAYQMYGLKAVAASRALAYILDSKPHKERILAAEEQALRLFDGGKVSEAFELLDGFYRKFTLEHEDAETLKEYARAKPLRSRLYYVEPTAFAPTASPINKVLVSTLMRPPEMHVAAEKAALEEKTDSRMVAKNGTTETPIDKMRLIVRHGADPAAWNLLDPVHRATLEAATPSVLTTVVPDQYDLDFYLRKPSRPLAPSNTHKKAEYLSAAHDLLLDMLDHVTECSRKVSLERNRGATWKVKAPPESRRELRSLFPIGTESFSVELADERPTHFKAPR